MAFVIGANDVDQSLRQDGLRSPIYGMPVLDVEKAAPCCSSNARWRSAMPGVDNDVFYRDNTMMLLADAKKMVEGIVKALD